MRGFKVCVVFILDEAIQRMRVHVKNRERERERDIGIFYYYFPLFCLFGGEQNDINF